MNEYIRINATISPYVEDLLNNFIIDDNMVAFFLNSNKIFRKIKHISLLAIPAQLKIVFYAHSKLRIVASLIENDTQSNIMFYSANIVDGCKLKDITELFEGFPYSLYALNYIQFSIRNESIPLITDINNNTFKKKDCDLCGRNLMCGNAMELFTSTIPTIEALSSAIKEICQTNIDLCRIKKKDLNSEKLKTIAFLMGVLNNFNEETFDRLNKCIILDDFCRDIEKRGGVDCVNIAFSLFRAIAFPSATNQTGQRSRYSIDWHRNDPHKIDDYKLYRVDVVAPKRTGISGSGVERLLLAEKGSVFTFIAYSDNHDFVVNTIKSRLREKSGGPGLHS